MDEAQIKELIATAVGALKTEMTEQINTSNQGLAASLTREIKKATAVNSEDKSEGKSEDKSEGKLSMKALQGQIQQLTKQLSDEKEAKYRSASNAALTAAIADSGAQGATTLRKLLTAEYSGKLKEEDGAWFVSEGDSTKSLKDSIATYLATPEGKMFIPPSGTTGAGSTETKSTVPKTSTDGTLSNAQFSEAFSDI